MKFLVNEKCIGCGLCTSICPDISQMTDAGVAEAKGDDVEGEETRSAALEAKDSCPVDAIENE